MKSRVVLLAAAAVVVAAIGLPALPRVARSIRHLAHPVRELAHSVRVAIQQRTAAAPAGSASAAAFTTEESAPPARRPAEPPPHWTVPAGIPAPDFGVEQQARPAPDPWTSPVPGYYYVDASRRGATDDHNDYGTPGRPRQTIPTVLPAGAVVELHGTYDQNHGSPRTITAQGTAAQPVFIRGVSASERPQVRGGWEVRGTYAILENLDFGPIDDKRTGSLVLLAPANRLVLRGSNIHGNANGGGLGIESWTPPATIDHTVILGNTIHDNGNVSADFDQDVHGIAVGSRVTSLWVIGNEMYRNSGDGIQINGGRGGNETTHHIYVARNVSHDNKQTGFWTKQASDVVFYENLCYGHRFGNSSYGQCMGMQYAPERVWFISNHIHDCDVGIAFSSDDDLGTGKDTFVIGNVIHDIHHSGDYNPNTSWSNAAVMLAGGTLHVVVNNTLYDVDAGVNSPVRGTNYIVNNIIDGVANAGGQAVFLEQPDSGATATLHHNLVGRDAHVRWGGESAASVTALERTAAPKVFGNVIGAARFVDPAGDDFHLQADSPGAGAASDEPKKLLALYRGLYGVDLRADFSVMGAWDAFALKPPRRDTRARRPPAQGRGLLPEP